MFPRCIWRRKLRHRKLNQSSKTQMLAGVRQEIQVRRPRAIRQAVVTLSHRKQTEACAAWLGRGEGNVGPTESPFRNFSI